LAREGHPLYASSLQTAPSKRPYEETGKKESSTIGTSIVSAIDNKDDEVTLPSSSKSRPSSISRALRLMEITWDDWVLPVGQCLWMASQQRQQVSNVNYSNSSEVLAVQFPTTWDEFWELPIPNDQSSVDGSTSTVTVAQQFTKYLERLGVTFVKFGQALSARPDIVPRSLAISLSKLQDQMDVASSGLDSVDVAREFLRIELSSNRFEKNITAFRTVEDLDAFLDSLVGPVAAASIGVVYAARIPSSNQKVCIKIQRPDIGQVVSQDAILLRRAAEFLESIPALSDSNGQAPSRLIQTNLTGAVDEFMSRIFEELDYQNECKNLQLFSALYSHRRFDSTPTAPRLNEWNQNEKAIQVVVPEVYEDLCTKKVLIMEWIEGTKFSDLQRRQIDGDKDGPAVTLDLIKQGIDSTLSQLLGTGLLHADPHGGNLMVIEEQDGDISLIDKAGKGGAVVDRKYRLGYVDFGLLSVVPPSVQEALICAVAQLVFSRNVAAVADLFGDLQLLPKHVVNDASERKALTEELENALSQVLVYDTSNDDESSSVSTIPSLRFDKLLDVLARLVPRFQFQLPPYFLNNARALSTLEGMAREADPSFNVLQSVYPFAINRLLSNPTSSKVVESTLRSILESPETGRLDPAKVKKLVEDAAILSGYSRRKVLKDVLKSRNGRRLALRLAREQTLERAAKVSVKNRRLNKMADYFRL